METPTVGILWVIYNNPSGSDDIASAICYVDDTILVFGFDSSPGDPQFRVEIRDAGDGSLKGYRVYNPGSGNDALLDCIVWGGHVYAAGLL